ncbi:MAG: HlyC/CorC family transporter [Anaerolineae bacterium]|nr:HlyC/CorC family transporter [Anaerolineae bacterium]MBT7072306.1 HlyC/CorC family transporter [Anaerolineae bacterium]MBT7326026.1 HlyC/CorC family transporter [Anaerolineae bacterium]
MITTGWGLLTIALLLILDLMIAATRVSLSNARVAKLLVLQEEKPASAKRAIALHESSRLVAVLRLSQTSMRFGIAIIGFLLIQSWTLTSPRAWLLQVVGLFALTVVMLLIEFTVESNALADPEEWALRLSSFGNLLVFVFTPFVLLPLLLLDPQRVSKGTMAQMTEDDLRTWVETDEESGGLEREERRMIYEIFQFGETIAREIMVPRIDVLALDEDAATLSSAVQAFLDSGYSRLPVYKESIDNILGLLYAKDLLGTLSKSDDEVQLRELLREPYFIPETKKADDLLAEMQEKRFHMAIVVDEYGGVSGVVTLEDIIEEIIGEIQDEYDEREEAPFKKISEDEYIFQGLIDVDDFTDVTGVSLPEGDADTLAGFLYEQLGRVPQGGESVRVKGLLLTIEQVIGRRIRRVRSQPVLENPKEESTDDRTDE